MLRLLFRKAAFFSRITPEILPTLIEQFEMEPSLKALGSHYSPLNGRELLELIDLSDVTQVQSNEALDHLLELCRDETDEQLELKADVIKRKALNYTQLTDFANAINEFQRSVSIMKAMKKPNVPHMTQLYRSISDLYVQVNNFKEAENSLRQAENLLNSHQLQQKNQNRGSIHYQLASIYTQLSKVLYGQQRGSDALKELSRALQNWEKSAQKPLSEYELTYRLKCMCHILVDQNIEAVKTADQFLSFLEKTRPQFQKEQEEYEDQEQEQIEEVVEGIKQAAELEQQTNSEEKPLQFMRVFYLNVICTLKPERKNEEEEILAFLRQIRRVKGPKALGELMTVVGIPSNRYSLTQ